MFFFHFWEIEKQNSSVAKSVLFQWGTCSKKKPWFPTLFWVFFSFPASFYENKMHGKLGKSAFFGILPSIIQQKKFFQHLFCIFFTKKFPIFNFPPPHMSKYPLDVKKIQKSAEKTFFCYDLQGKMPNTAIFFKLSCIFCFRKMRWGMKKC